MSPQPGVFRPLSSLNQNPNGFLSPGSVVGVPQFGWWYPKCHIVTLEIHESMIRDSNESENCCDYFLVPLEVSFLSLLLLPSSFPLCLFYFHSFLLSLVFLPSFRSFRCFCGIFTPIQIGEDEQPILTLRIFFQMG